MYKIATDDELHCIYCALAEKPLAQKEPFLIG